MVSAKTTVSLLTGVVGILLLAAAIYLMYASSQQIQNQNNGGTKASSGTPLTALILASLAGFGILLALVLSYTKNLAIISASVIAVIFLAISEYFMYLTYSDLLSNSSNSPNNLTPLTNNNSTNNSASRNADVAFWLALVAGLLFLLALLATVGFRFGRSEDGKEVSSVPSIIFGLIGLFSMIVALYFLYSTNLKIVNKNTSAKADLIASFILIGFGLVFVLTSLILQAEASRYPLIFGVITLVLALLVLFLLSRAEENLDSNPNSLTKSRDYVLASFALMFLVIIGVIATWISLYRAKNPSTKPTETKEIKSQEPVPEINSRSNSRSNSGNNSGSASEESAEDFYGFGGTSNPAGDGSNSGFFNFLQR